MCNSLQLLCRILKGVFTDLKGRYGTLLYKFRVDDHFSKRYQLRPLNPKLIYYLKELKALYKNYFIWCSIVALKSNNLNVIYTNPPSDQFRVQLSSLRFFSGTEAKQTKPNISPSFKQKKRSTTWKNIQHWTTTINCFTSLFAFFSTSSIFQKYYQLDCM